MQRLWLVLLISPALWAGTQAPFARGVNLTGWFQKSSARQIQFTQFTRQDLVNIQSLGCDVIRLPLNLHAMTDGEPNYTLDPLFLEMLDLVIDWSEELQLHLILDNHSFDPSSSTDPNIGQILIPVWTQMAQHYRDRTDLLYYEILNEPHGIDDETWNDIQVEVVKAIRHQDPNHTIIVGPADWNSYNNLQYMPGMRDENLIYTFHFYDPFLFTHQGATWTNPSLAPLAGVPFPYDANLMPTCPNDLEGTWAEGALNVSYATEGTAARVKELIDRAVTFQNERQVPLLCGEFGVYIPNSDPNERVNWYELVRTYLEQQGIAWTCWDYTGGFGIFEPNGYDLFEHDLNIPLLAALDLNTPDQTEYVKMPETIGFDLYQDYIAHGLYEASWSNSGSLDYYDTQVPDRGPWGQYCMAWTGVNQYGTIRLNFKPDKDLSLLVEQGYGLDLWIQGDTPDTKIDVRFLDSKLDETDHPWRMRKTIDDSLVTWDGTWQHLHIPLSDFSEHGSWDNGWYNPQGLFDWTEIDNFEVVAEHHSLEGIQIRLDAISIASP